MLEIENFNCNNNEKNECNTFGPLNMDKTIGIDRKFIEVQPNYTMAAYVRANKF